MENTAQYTLSESFLIAKKRHQPYINLTNKIHKIDDLLSESSFKEYKELELKSLYFRTTKLVLDEQFGIAVNKLTKAGIKEIFIFCSKEESQLNTQQLNKFLEANNIRINFKIAQVSETEFENISKDSIGKKDLLGFISLINNKVTYQDGINIDLLNDEATKDIILYNHADYKKGFTLEHTFVVQEPKYIISSDSVDAEKRVKILSVGKDNFELESQLQLEISKNIDLSIGVDASIEEENELDLDIKQADNKFTEQEAIEQAKKLLIASFYEHYIEVQQEKNYEVLYNSYGVAYNLINKIFKSDEQVKYITSMALDLIVKKYFLFQEGININNMPIGLAFKNNIIFASDQRLLSMPINDFTINLDAAHSTISNPLKYSWLPFATKSSVSLNDIYGTDIAPRLHHEDEHPAIKERTNLDDRMLDIPCNQYFSEYGVDNLSKEIDYKSDFDRKGFKNKGEIRVDILDSFPAIKFYDLLQSDLKQLTEIHSNLEQRGMLQVFCNIIMSSLINDGGFLLEEKASIFLEKLFKEILPISEDNKKLQFFKQVLDGHKFKQESNIEDVFEGLDGCYKKFQAFLIKEEITNLKERSKLEALFVEIIQNQVRNCNSFKIISERLISIIELSMDRGGNLKEQMEYLANQEASSMLKDPQQYLKAKDLGLNTIHKSAALDIKLVSEYEKIPSIEELMKQLTEATFSEYSIYRNQLLISTLRYLSAIQPHQRPSIDTYTKFFEELPSLYFSNKKLCFSRSIEYQSESIDTYNRKKDLKTVEYFSSKILSYSYKISDPEQELQFYLSYKPLLELTQADQDLPSTHFIIIVNEDAIYFKYTVNEIQGIIKLGEQEGRNDGINKVISHLQQYKNTENSLSLFTLDELGMNFIAENLDLDAITENQELMQVVESRPRPSYSSGELYIKSKGKDYSICISKVGKDEVINKTKIILPAVLEERIQEWYENGKIDNSIKLTASEVDGTFFENFANAAHKNSQNELLMLADGDFATLQYNLNNAPKELTKNPCFIPSIVLAENANLVTNFTTKQASENVRLLSLNILSSTGKYYNKLYPDQEFASYVSLFNVLFSGVKVYEELEASEYVYEAIEDYNKKTISIEVKSSPSKPLRSDIEAKERQHKKMVDSFIAIFKENPEFNFSQIVALGLVATINQTLADTVIQNAKILLEYNEHFSQLLRILLSTPTSNTNVAEELNARAEAIARNINYLLSKVIKDEIEFTVHELLTHNGQYPENLQFFAACLGQESTVTYEQIMSLISKLNKLEPHLKDLILESFASTKLPYDNGQIIPNSNFPIISLSALEDPNQLNNIVQKAEASKLSYANETRFNDISINKMQNTKVDLTSLEVKYHIQLPVKLKNKSYAELKKDILDNKISIENQLLTNKDDDAVIRNIAFDITQLLLESLSSHNSGWQAEIKKVTTLLFNPNKSLQNQLLDIESNKRNIEILLKKCSASNERDIFLDSLLRTPAIPQGILKQTLNFLKTIDQEVLKAKGYTLTTLLLGVSNELISKHFDAFKIATEFFMTSNIGISLEELYTFIQKISGIDDTTSSAKKIITYCIKNTDYSVIHILSKLNYKLDNIDQVIDLITSIAPVDIKKLNENPNLNFQKLLKIKDVEKIKIITDIALKLDKQLENSEYNIIVKQITNHDIYYAQLLKSYLLAPSLKDLTKKAQIKLILDNVESLENVQIIFSQYNLNRFNYNENRLVTKIQEIKHKNGEAHDDTDLLLVEQKELYRSFIAVLQKAKYYKDLNTNKLHDKAIELKHAHKLLKDAILGDNREVDLEFLALSFEMMYRETSRFPRDIQILSVLNTIIHSNHLIHEVATGQGKSIITALHASYLWFTGQTVDVVTSNKYLAAKDLQEFSSYYSNLGIDHSEYIISADSEIKEYKKGGINYSVPSDLALFRADREFYSNKIDLALNADVSLVCDEIDSALTSDINYKLAVPLINTNQEETRALFSYIIDFAATLVFQNNNTSRKDDIKNLELYLKYQFQKFDSSYIYPLSILQIHDLKLKNNPEARKLYLLHQALYKCSKDSDNIFDQLLDSVVAVRQLREGIEYVLLKEDLENEEQLLKATPIIKDQPSKGTMFGNGVQAFLHLLIEREHTELQLRFDVSPPTSTIFNVSPKNFFDYYKMSGGRIVGLTGTAGNKDEIEEFRVTNKMLAYYIPRFEEDKKLVTQIEVNNADDQFKKVLDILNDTDSTRPVIIFCDNTKEAEKVFNKLVSIKHNLQLCASSANDSGTIQSVVDHAGMNGYITVTTPMLGRGTDFFTSNKDGFFAINLCTDITSSSLKQIYGRVARNGDKGEVISIFNREHYELTITSHMDDLSLSQKALRMKSQPLTDVLKYFNIYNQDNAVNAIMCNLFISKTWNTLLKENHKVSLEAKKSYSDLKADLIALVKAQYPHVTKNLDEYLRRVDEGVPAKIDAYQHEIPFANITQYITPPSLAYSNYQAQYYLEIERAFIEQCDIRLLDYIPKFSNLHQKYSASYAIQDANIGKNLFYPLNKLISLDTWQQQYWGSISNYARSTPIDQIEVPSTNNPYKAFYNNLYHAQMAVMYTHAFSIEEVDFKFYDEFTYSFTREEPIADKIDFNEMVFFINQDKTLYCQIRNKEAIKIKFDKNSTLDDILQQFYKKVLNTICETKEVSSKEIKLNSAEKTAINKFLLQSNYIKEAPIKAEGSMGDLMLYEFKKSFAAYKHFVNSKEVDQISNIIENFFAIQNIDMIKLEPGKYQAINIETKFDSTASHAESILTDGRFLFWINRGGGSEEPGIKIFKIIKDIEQVRNTLNKLKITQSQTDTRKAIFSLLREESSNDIPEHTLIKMTPQLIGNCGWVQTKSMLKASAFVGRMGILDDLPDVTTSEWQKALKDSDDIYKDFTTYDRIKRTEAIIFSFDKKFKPKFLSLEEQTEINLRREVIDEPALHDLLVKLSKALASNIAKVDNTIYEKQAYAMLDIIELEAAVGSEMGTALQSQYDYDRQSVKELLSVYQNDMQNEFEILDSIYKSIKDGRIESKILQDSVFHKIVKYIIDSSYYIYNLYEFIEQITSITKRCAASNLVNELCILNHLEQKILADELSKNTLEPNTSDYMQTSPLLENQCPSYIIDPEWYYL